MEIEKKIQSPRGTFAGTLQSQKALIVDITMCDITHCNIRIFLQK